MSAVDCTSKVPFWPSGLTKARRAVAGRVYWLPYGLLATFLASILLPRLTLASEEETQHLTLGGLKIGMSLGQVQAILSAPCLRPLAGTPELKLCTAQTPYVFEGVSIKEIKGVARTEITISFGSSDYDVIKAALLKAYPDPDCEDLCIINRGHESIIVGRRLRGDDSTGALSFRTKAHLHKTVPH